MNRQQAYGHGQGDSPYCCFHPRELVVGVCAHCLKDRLLLLLATKTADATLRQRTRTTSISLPKVFALGSSFLQRLDSRHHRSGPDAAAPNYSDGDGTTSAARPDVDSFISIKFEDNGKATWDSHKVVKAAPPAPSTVVVVENANKRGGVIRWRKQVVGRLLQLARWKRSGGAAAGCHVGLDGKKVAGERSSKARGRGWIRSLTRRRAAAAHGERAWL